MTEVTRSWEQYPEVGSLADYIAGVCIDMPQVECPVIHHFGPGIYIRELSVPAGTLLVGHRQRYDHMNIFLRGSVLMFNDDGSTVVLNAPMIFVGKPGQKIGYIIEDMVWQNVYATDETDIETLENMFFEKSQIALDHHAYALLEQQAARQVDRQDFLDLATEMGTTPDELRRQSDEVPYTPFLGMYSSRVSVRDSPIDGRGVFLSAPVVEGEYIAPAFLEGQITVVGRFTNHAKSPNARAVRFGNDLYFAALRDIHGCLGGDAGEEITVDYRQVKQEMMP